jgi:hypothetical protein
LYRNDSKISDRVPTTPNASVEFNIDGQRPFTVYVYRVEICTSGGCGSSEITIRTAEDVPREYNTVPVGVALSARSILVSWSPPSQPNGIITSYTLWYRLTCPQPEQPQLTSSNPCTEGPLIRAASTDQTQYTVTGTATNPFPYSRYQFIVEAQNSIGAVNTSFSMLVETEATAPEVKESLEFDANQTTGIVTLNWGSTFRPNGPVQRYTLTRNGIALLSRPTTSVVLSNEPRGTDLRYVVTIQTNIGEASTDPVTLRLQEISTSDMPTLTTGDPSEDSPPFHKEAAFIVGMVVLGACLLFIAGAVGLCFIRPRGNPAFPASPQSISTHLETLPKHSDSANRNRHSRGTVTGSWSPGQPIWEELPDLGDEGDPLVTPRKHKSYSPRREDEVRLLEGEVLPDTHISGYANGSISRQPPHYITSAEEDFGTFRASQTTFADTKV